MEEIGIFPGVSFADYLEWDGVNGSALSQAILEGDEFSMRHLRAALDGLLGPKTPASNLGRAAHCRLLEPHLFEESYLIATPCSAIRKTGDLAGKKCGATASLYNGEVWRCKTHKNSVEGLYEPDAYLSQSEGHAVQRMYEAVCFEHQASKLLHLEGGFETSVRWQYNDVQMKSRIDKDIPDPKYFQPCCVDLKKVAKGGHAKKRFARAIERYHYDMKAAIYLDALKSIDGIQREFFWIVVEEDEPYDVAVHQASKDLIKIGRHKYMELMKMYETAVQTEQWPGVQADLEPIQPTFGQQMRYDYVINS